MPESRPLTEADREWAEDRPRVGISTCLLGEPVRYDGQHKLDRHLTGTVGKFVEWVPVCPEVECGLPTPREAMRLVREDDRVRLVTTRSGRDITDRMLRFCRRRVAELEEEDLCGFIFKSGSPSSGMARVKVYDENGVPSRSGTGLFACAFMDHFPLVPVEDDGRLHDPGLRENFFERLFCLRDYRRTAGRRSSSELIRFHAEHKMQLLAHSPEKMRRMGRSVAEAGKLDRNDLFDRYEDLLMEAMAQPADAGRHANVLTHMLGYFRKELTSDEKRELLETVEQYRGGLIPLIVPVTLARHYVRKYKQDYLSGQSYLNPHPLELKLRNHA